VVIGTFYQSLAIGPQREIDVEDPHVADQETGLAERRAALSSLATEPGPQGGSLMREARPWF
jgi:hypothetical protein